ncbi:MAG TPA: response regulator [Bacteroidota bacterium]|nr:response regulator [Bacteroidota bacterium]
MLNILIVDDEPDFRNLLFDYITENSENNVVCAESGAQGIEILKEHVRNRRPIHFIISDVFMPGMNGYGFYEHVRGIPEYKYTPFLYLSAYDDTTVRGAIHEPYIEGFLKKSDTREKLLAWIEFLSTPLTKRAQLVRP